MFCMKCGTEQPEGALHCFKCGEKLLVENSNTMDSASPSEQVVSPPALVEKMESASERSPASRITKVCKNCGTENESNNVWCSKCDRRLEWTKDEKKTILKQKSTASSNGSEMKESIVWKNVVLTVMVIITIFTIGANMSAVGHYRDLEKKISSRKDAIHQHSVRKVEASADRLNFHMRSQEYYLWTLQRGMSSDGRLEKILGSPRTDAYGKIQWYHDK